VSAPTPNTPGASALPRDPAWTAHAIARDVRDGTRSAQAIIDEALARAAALNPALNAFLHTFGDAPRAHARALDERLARARAAGHDLGATLPLAGVPLIVKDNICLGADLDPASVPIAYDAPTTCASRFLERYTSPFSATCVRRAVEAGAIPIAKSNLDEFAMGSSGENSAFGATRNPHDHTRVPGGSSSGSAAGVAAGIAPIALGSDTGGSIRQPAAFCGVVGLKPTYGRVSRFGLVAYASSLDQVGPLATTTRDTDLLLRAIAGRDDRDATSSSREVTHGPRTIARVGLVRRTRDAANHPAVAAALDDACAALRAAGVDVVDVDVPMLDAGIAAYYVVAPAEAASNLARFDGVRYGRRAALAPDEGLDRLYARSRAEGFGPEVTRRIMLGTHVLSSGYFDAYYTTAARARRRILEDFTVALDGARVGARCDALLLPTTPGPAFRLGSDPLAMYLEDVYTVAVNLAGLPAISVPCGAPAIEQGDAGPVSLPVGVQFVARAFDEAALLGAAGIIEAAAI
jgi:aspartyl-tRNA(Asn)/glutamyl-tRNA(Gln) amidotransferase subunit A